MVEIVTDTEFPFPAWDIYAQQVVTVVGWTDDGYYRLASGLIASVRSVTNDFPAWYRRAQEQLDAEHDLLDTRRTALDVAIQ